MRTHRCTRRREHLSDHDSGRDNPDFLVLLGARATSVEKTKTEKEQIKLRV